MQRVMKDTAVELPHQDLLDEVADDPSSLERLDAAVRNGQMPPSYYNHKDVLMCYVRLLYFRRCVLVSCYAVYLCV